MSLAKSCHYASPAISETEAPFGAMKAKNLPSLVLSTDSFSGNDDEFGNNSVAERTSPTTQGGRMTWRLFRK